MYIHLRADALWLIYRIQPSGNILFVYLENYGYLLFDWFWLDACNEMNPTTKRENSTVLSSQLDFPIFGVRHILFIYLSVIRVFHEHTELTKMTILASQALLRENKKKISNKILPH